MLLEQLLPFESIAIQCHDDPDADAVASGFGLYCFFERYGKDVRLFYSGSKEIGKPNLKNLTGLLNIPLEYHPEPDFRPDLLITVDAQYGSGNIRKVDAGQVAVIDHHSLDGPPPALSDIRPDLGACSTLVWTLMREAGFDIDPDLGAALRYGLFADTGAFAEVRHPLDRDLRDLGRINERIFRQLKNSNLSLSDLALAAAALKDLRYHPDGGLALLPAPACDPNLLGFISDLAIQTDTVAAAVAFTQLDPGRGRFSIRTDTREMTAVDLARDLTADGLGSGGGHVDKAGGSLNLSRLRDLWPGRVIQDYIRTRFAGHRQAYRLIDCSDNGSWRGVDVSGFQVFEKLPTRLAFVPCADLPREKTVRLRLRMLEGDIGIEADEDTYLMIGLTGEVYPIKKDQFQSKYQPTGQPADLELSDSYPPVVVDPDSGLRLSLPELARACLVRGGARVIARRLSEGVKVFTIWDNDNYLRGKAGDWLVRGAAPNDFYVVTEAIFPRLYKAIN